MSTDVGVVATLYETAADAAREVGVDPTERARYNRGRRFTRATHAVMDAGDGAPEERDEVLETLELALGAGRPYLPRLADRMAWELQRVAYEAARDVEDDVEAIGEGVDVEAAAEELLEEMDDDVATDGSGRPALDELEVGDRFELPTGAIITIVGVAPVEESPVGGSSPLYEGAVGDGEHYDDPEERRTVLYASHNFRSALEGGAEYVGRVDVEEPAAPFWCDACEWSRRGGLEYDPVVGIDGARVCSYGCFHSLRAERRREKWERREA